MVFNTLSYAKKLEEAGIPRDQAEAHIQIMAEIIEGDLATKLDVKNLETNVKHEIKDLKDEMQKLEYRLVIKLGAIVVTVVTIAIALTSWIIKLH
jgi:hypothetical protein